MSELFDFAVQADNPTEKRRIERLKKKYDKWKLAHPIDNNEAFIEFSQRTDGKFNLVNWYVTRRLTDAFVVNHGRRYTWYMNSYYPDRHEGIQKARSVIDTIIQVGGVGGSGIITTNYDLVAEYSLGTRAFNYGELGEQIGFTPYPYPKPIYVTGSIPIAKLHGSISWDKDRKYPDSRCGLSGKCLIVPPIKEKTAPHLLKNQWTTAKSLLSSCDKLLVFGFAFNDYDSEIRNFIAKSLRPKAQVVFVDLIDHRKRLAPLLKGHSMKHIDANAPELLKMIASALQGK